MLPPTLPESDPCVTDTVGMPAPLTSTSSVTVVFSVAGALVSSYSCAATASAVDVPLCR